MYIYISFCIFCIYFIYWVELLHILELCAQNTRFLWYAGSVHIHKLPTCKQNTNTLLKLFRSDQLLLLMLLILPLQLPYCFYSQSIFWLPTTLGGGGLCPPLTLLSHLHLVLNKYFPRDFILFIFVQLIIILYAKSSFISSQLLFTHSSLHFFVSEQFSNYICRCVCAFVCVVFCMIFRVNSDWIPKWN
jgi:hypothetical protein